MQLTVFIRNMRSVFFTLAFPIMMIVLFASGSSGQANIPAQQGVDVTMASWTIVGLCCYTLLMGTFVRVAGDMAAQRSTSLLKRLRLRSTSDAAVIAGYIVTASIIALACTLILIVFGMAVYHLPMPKKYSIDSIGYSADYGGALAHRCCVRIVYSQCRSNSDYAAAARSSFDVPLRYLPTCMDYPSWATRLRRMVPPCALNGCITFRVVRARCSTRAGK